MRQYKYYIGVALVAFAYALIGAVAARHLLQPTPDVSALPEQCISAGLTLQGSCASEIDNATRFFGLEGQNSSAAANISSVQINAYLNSTVPPTPACCSAACAFNAQLCSCDTGILTLISSFTGNNPQTYNQIAEAFSRVCRFDPYISATCPPDHATVPKPYGKPCPIT